MSNKISSCNNKFLYRASPDKTSWDYCINDDSSSLGYGSGSYSSSSGDQDFYKTDQTTAEFYDLDSVHSFCLAGAGASSYSHSESECPYCLPRSKQLLESESWTIKLKPNNECCDIDDVQPSEQLLAGIQQDVKPSSSSFDGETTTLESLKNLKVTNNKNKDTCNYEIRTRKPTGLDLIISKTRRKDSLKKCTRSVDWHENDDDDDDDDHIYEEIHYDSPNVDISGLRPPPLPIRNTNMNTIITTNKSLNRRPRAKRLLFDSCGRLIICDEQKTHL